MSWARVDDHANEHPKLLEVGGEAAWLWVCGLMYSNRQRRRDGHIPKQAITMLYPFRAATQLAKKLVKAGLWVEHENTYEIHDYADWNKSDEQVSNEREVTRVRVARFREKRSSNGSGNGVTPLHVTEGCNGVSNADVLDPLHSTPLPDQKTPTESRRVSLDADVKFVFEAWKQDTGKHRATLDPKRKSRIAARLRDGFTAEDLVKAITHRRNDPFLMGQSESGRVFDDIPTLLRDVPQVERLRDLTEPMRPNGQHRQPPPKQPSSGYRSERTTRL